MEADEDEVNHPIVLAKNVRDFELEFWDNRRNDWTDEWRQTNQLPRLVMFTLRIADNEYARIRHRRNQSHCEYPRNGRAADVAGAQAASGAAAAECPRWGAGAARLLSRSARGVAGQPMSPQPIQPGVSRMILSLAPPFKRDCADHCHDLRDRARDSRGWVCLQHERGDASSLATPTTKRNSSGLGRSGVEYARWILAEQMKINMEPYDGLEPDLGGQGTGGIGTTNSPLLYVEKEVRAGERLASPGKFRIASAKRILTAPTKSS